MEVIRDDVVGHLPRDPLELGRVNKSAAQELKTKDRDE
jgi:hypothetical protein